MDTSQLGIAEVEDEEEDVDGTARHWYDARRFVSFNAGSHVRSAKAVKPGILSVGTGSDAREKIVRVAAPLLSTPSAEMSFCSMIMLTETALKSRIESVLRRRMCVAAAKSGKKLVDMMKGCSLVSSSCLCLCVSLFNLQRFKKMT